jgi:LuxR family maltose regulon positive regulatory protein
MSATLPIVADGRLFDPQQPQSLRLDSPAWFAWLEAPTTTRFAYPLLDRQAGYSVGRLTVRRERRGRGGHYWIAYQRHKGHLRKVYLGGSATVTAARLEDIARAVLQRW